MKIAVLLALSGWTLAAIGQSYPMPNDEALKKAMEAAQKRAGKIMGDAEKTATPMPVLPQRVIPQFDARQNFSQLDPGAIAEQYKNLGKEAKDNDPPQVMIFASLSMPEEALKRLGVQAKQAGAVVIFRGLKYGLRKGAWTASMNALKPIADTGAEVQIHPELFARYNITAVPTLVVVSSPQSGCQDDACVAASAAVVGDVSLDYALDRLTIRTDAIGKIARERIRKLRG